MQDNGSLPTGETHVSLAAAPLNIVTPLTLEGSVVRLVPIRHQHAELFCEAAKHDLENIFRWIPYPMRTVADFQLLVEKAFEEQERGESVVFATIERSSEKVIGSTRFMNIDRVNRRVYLDRARQATHGNRHRSKIPDAASRLRSVAMHSR